MIEIPGSLCSSFPRSFDTLQLTFYSHRAGARRQCVWGHSSWPSGLPGSLATCWCGETGKRSDLSSHRANALVGSNPITSTLALFLLTRRCWLPMFEILERSQRSQFRYATRAGERCSPAFDFVGDQHPELRRRQDAKTLRRSGGFQKLAVSSALITAAASWRLSVFSQRGAVNLQALSVSRAASPSPRVPFAVVQQVLAHPVVLFRRNLARHKEEPSDFYARHQPVLDHEIVVDQLRDERCRRAWRACGSSLKKGDRRCGPGLRAHVGSDGIRALVDFIQRPARQDPQE